MSHRLILPLTGGWGWVGAAHLPLQKFPYFVSKVDMEVIQQTRPNKNI